MPPSNKKLRGRQRKIAQNNKNANNGQHHQQQQQHQQSDGLKYLNELLNIFKTLGPWCRNRHGAMMDHQRYTPKGQCVNHAFSSAFDFAYNSETLPIAVNKLVAKFPQIIEDDEFFALLKAQIIAFGIDILYVKKLWEVAETCASFVIFLEHKYDCSRQLEGDSTGGKDEDETKEKKKTTNKKKHCKEFRDLYGDGERGVILFFDRQVECKCLKDLFMKYVKNKPKMGDCFKCSKKMEYMVLKKCKRCSIAHYCNKDCQVEHWPHHKACCDSVVDGTINRINPFRFCYP